jgi:nitrile hydratase subunit beta
MNGVHDMGGMHGMGPIVVEKNEPVFHARWEARVIAMRRAVAATGKLPVFLRPAIERITAVDYLRMSYYEKWFTALVAQLIETGLATRAEIESGKPAAGSSKAIPLSASEAATLPFRVSHAILNAGADPRFQAGQRVRARNIHPVSHTRLPRYVRGRTGVIEKDRGIQDFADTVAQSLGPKPQHVYSVRFAARELWGEQASPRDAVYLDLWDDYLEPA